MNGQPHILFTIFSLITPLNNLCPAFGAAKKHINYFRFQTSPLYRLKQLLFNLYDINLWMKSTNVLFWLRKDRTKNIISPVPKGDRKVIETSNKPVFKDKILIVCEGELFLKEQAILIKLFSAQTWISECKYSHKTKMVPTYMYRMYLDHFTQITLKIQPAFKLLQKPHTIL